MKKPSKAGRSAYGVAATRAMEMFEPPILRLFEDDIVIDLLPGLARFMLRRASIRAWFKNWFERQAPGIRGALLCRTRCIDDMLKAGIARGLRSAVILGAGLDTRAYRLPELANAHVFELDLPHVQAAKRARLTRSLAASESHVRFVPIDFNVEAFDTALAANGFDVSQPALFVWEGVTQYLQPAAVDAVLRTILSMAPGSELVFTYVLEEAVTGRFRADRSEDFRKVTSRLPEPWLFGIDPSKLQVFLADRGLVLCEDLGAEQHIARYLQPIHRDLTVSPIERVARASVAPRPAPLVR
jgi:methyltransferase (TIGR00027 family)